MGVQACMERGSISSVGLWEWEMDGKLDTYFSGTEGGRRVDEVEKNVNVYIPLR
jgi:hypothetical protein